MYIGKHLSADDTISALNALIDTINGIFEEFERGLGISEVETPEKKHKPTRREIARISRRIHLPEFKISKLRVHLPDSGSKRI